MSEQKNAKKNEYLESHYDKVRVAVKVGQKEKIKKMASDNGENISQYIKRLIKEDIERYGE